MNFCVYKGLSHWAVQLNNLLYQLEKNILSVSFPIAGTKVPDICNLQEKQFILAHLSDHSVDAWVAARQQQHGRKAKRRKAAHSARQEAEKEQGGAKDKNISFQIMPW